MKLTWLGHSCFQLEEDGYKIITDPYTGVDGYPELKAQAHEVLCSHQHKDHGYVKAVELLPARKSPFAVREIATFHDDQGGTARGENTIRVFTAGGVSVAHLGDLGHQLTDEQLAAIGKVDGILIPVGGTYTIDAAGAKQVCDAIAPKWIIPMHYRSEPYGYPVLSGVEDFVKLWPEVRRLDGAELEVTPELAGVLVLKFA